jgi:hypothetical protein
MGDNKYLLFSVTNAYTPDANARGLNAYTVDMNADHGKGAITGSPTKIIESASANMSESIELLAASETGKYWLIYAYYHSERYELRVRSVDVSGGTPAISDTYSSHATSNTSSVVHTYTLKASPQHNRIAIAHSDNKTVDVFDFDNVTGTLSKLRTTPSSHHIDGLAYGVEFSPDGKQLYAAGYTKTGGNTPMLYQFTINDNNTLDYVGEHKYWTSDETSSPRGGGLKLGPDGRIYLVLAYDKNVGIVSSPNLTTTLSTRYSTKELNYDPSSYALQFSTGITKPSKIECNTNLAPTTLPDSAEFCVSTTSKTAKVNVMENDFDTDAVADIGKIYLTGAGFVDADDAKLAEITVNPADSSVTLTLKPNAYISVAGHVFAIDYHVKDNGTPASQCATGRLKITAYPTPTYSDIRVCACPDAGIINLAKYIDTANLITSIEWKHPFISIPDNAGTISMTPALAASRIHTLTYTVSSRCVSDQKRKVYLEILRNGATRTPKDTVAICYLYAEAVNINQLFGIEAGGTWTYEAIPGGDISAYVTESTSPVHAGAVVMNGKAIYGDDDIPFIENYHTTGNSVKMVKFTYPPGENSCLNGKPYSMVIVLTEDITM